MGYLIQLRKAYINGEGLSVCLRKGGSLNKNQDIFFLICVAIIIVGLVTFPLMKKDRSVVYDTGEEALASDVSPSVQPTEEMVYYVVYVTGQVEKPGVYKVPKGCRINEAIELAGGLTSKAVLGNINLAARVTDGQMIVVYSEDEPAEQATYKEEKPYPININTATMEQLMKLPGVGEAKAKAIIKYREANGEFHKIEDIMNISGIKEAMFNNIKDYITV